MNLESKMQNHICIKLIKNQNVILVDENYKEEHLLVSDVMFGVEHSNFIIISDYDGKLKKQASYNQYSEIDNKFIEEVYELNDSRNKIYLH